MTEMVNGDVQGQVPAPPVTSDAGLPQESGERTFKQSEVNDLVGRVKHEAVERYKRSQEVDRNRYEEPGYREQQESARTAPTQPQRPMDTDEIRRMAAEEFQRFMEKNQQEAFRRTQEQEAERIAAEFFTKFDAGKKKYDDFDKVTSDLDLQAIPNVVRLANMVDNTADVMYELAKNPAKIANLQQLISISPKMAFSEMKRLAESIKTNEEAAEYRAPNAPLSQMRPSNTGTDNRGALTVSDYRKKYKV